MLKIIENKGKKIRECECTRKQALIIYTVLYALPVQPVYNVFITSQS